MIICDEKIAFCIVILTVNTTILSWETKQKWVLSITILSALKRWRLSKWDTCWKICRDGWWRKRAGSITPQHISQTNSRAHFTPSASEYWPPGAQGCDAVVKPQQEEACRAATCHMTHPVCFYSMSTCVRHSYPGHVVAQDALEVILDMTPKTSLIL